MSIHEILKQHWGYASFRPLQEDIIQSVLDKKDTLALLPTGGGKSICFQVPALATEGMCLVISPLIALMEDQVYNLKKKNISAVAVTSGMSYREMQLAFDNCDYGKYKFLYLSPERLISGTVRQRLQHMKFSLLAVDEAHCISQWGYDFRPPYLRIAELRDYLPGVPVLALTATATPEVQKDIQQKLHFKKENVFKKTFERKNLSYLVYHEDSKTERIYNIISKVSGSGIIYVRNRRKTKEISDFLTGRGITSGFYHAGLDFKTRKERQHQWITGKSRVIVSTNAFGMGIDKPDVRYVIHYDIPESLEAYFQEAGRAGRDEKNAYAIALFNESDLTDLQNKTAFNYPPPDEIQNVYAALTNFLRIPPDSGKGVSYDFDLHLFCSSYKLNPMRAYNCLRLLEADGYLLLSDHVDLPSRVHIICDHKELYRFQTENHSFDNLIKTLLRSYGGLFDEFTIVHEKEIAGRCKMTEENVVSVLRQLKKLNILDYEPLKDAPQIVFLHDRIDHRHLKISRENYLDRKKVFKQKAEAMLNYVKAPHSCRGMMLLNYFGEDAEHLCGKCDYCRKRKSIEMDEKEFNHLSGTIRSLINDHPMTLNEIVKRINLTDDDRTIKMLQWMVDHQQVEYVNETMLQWRER